MKLYGKKENIFLLPEATATLITLKKEFLEIEKFDIKYSTLKRKLNSKGGMIINGILYCYESNIDKEV